MGYLSQSFNRYYNSNDENEKERIKENFKEIIWNTLPYRVSKRYFKYLVSSKNIKDKDIYDLFDKYKYIDYNILKSRYSLSDVEIVDLVKARINSNYGKYFDKRVYLKKEYYFHLANYKNIYFKFIKNEIDKNEAIMLIEKNNNDLKFYFNESCKYKYNLKWKHYKQYINQCFDKIFNNFIPLEEKIFNGEFEFRAFNSFDNNGDTKSRWDEDNYVLKYITTSMNGYVKDYINYTKGTNRKRKIDYMVCSMCGKLIERKSNRQKYCEDCRIIANRKNNKKGNKNKKKMAKKRFI